MPSLMELVAVSIFAPNSLRLMSDEYEIPLDRHLAGLAMLEAGVTLPFASFRSFEFHGIFFTGYGYKDALHEVEFTDGTKSMEWIGLHRIPFAANLRMLYSLSGLSFIKPSLSLGAGVQWMIQIGSTDFLRRSYLVPYYSISPALTFFESEGPLDWFRGFTFGVSFLNGFSSDRGMRAWSFDLSVNLLL